MTPAQARELLMNLTPLRDDCGRRCAGACCHSLEGEETGMLLFPGEEALYASLPGFRMVETAAGTLLICSGTCDRSQRPLSCRLFPLLPVLRGDAVRVEMDERARPVCPLVRYGKAGLSAEFAEAVEAVGKALAEDPEQAAFLRQLTQAQDELRALRSQLTGR